MTRRSLGRRLAVLALAAVAIGCPSLFRRPKKAATSALWLAGPSEIAAAPEMRRLEAVGVRELFLDAGELRAEGGSLRLVGKSALALPRRVPVTLVLRGSLPAGASASSSLVDEVRMFLLGAEGTGLFVVGLHLDLDVEGPLADLAGVAKSLRKALPDGRFLSVTIDRRRLGEEGMAQLARATDFWVAFLHGERQGGEEDPESWDLQITERDLRKLEDLDEPYLVGVVTLGNGSRIARDGRSTRLSPSVSLYSLLTHPALELVPGFSLQGIDRQVLELRARAAARVGGVEVGAGDRLRFVRTPTPVLEELQRLLGTLETPHRLGEVFFREPEAGDRLSLSPSSLAAALEPGPAEPQLAIEVDSLGADRGRFRFRLRLRSGNDEPTDVATLDHNFVSAHVPGGVVSDVELGQFLRAEVDRRDEPSRVAAVRRPDVVRLFAPLVEGRAELVSGPITVQFSGRPMRVTVSGDFVLSDGRVLAVPPVDWDLTP